MEDSIDAFIRFLAVERGLSENYQLSTQRSLGDFAHWCASSKKIDNPRAVTLPLISEYLGDRKRAGLSASSIKLIVVALKIFFRFLAGKRAIDRDPAEALTLPRIERYLPETLNELQVEQLIENIDTKVSLGLRHEINNCAHLADREKDFSPLRIGKEYLSAFAPAQLCQPSARQRRRPAHHPGNARPRRHFHDASLHPRRSTAIKSRPSAI